MKKCPYCSEKIHNEARKCKHCGEWLEETTSEEITDSKRGKTTNPMIRFLKYLLFAILSFIVVSIAETGVGLLVGIFAYIGRGWIIILGPISIGLLTMGISYITILIFRIIPNKGTGKIIFIIIFIFLTLATLIQIWGYTSDAVIPRNMKVIDSIGQILLCVILCFNSENLSEGTLFEN